TPSVPECVSPFVGECQSNNEIEIHLAFVPSRTVTWDPVLVRVRGNIGGIRVDVIPTMAQVASTLNKLNELYPMQVRLGDVRTHIASPTASDSGDLKNDLQEDFGRDDPTHFIDGLVPDDQQPAGQTFEFLRDACGKSNRGNGTFWSCVRGNQPFGVDS